MKIHRCKSSDTFYQFVSNVWFSHRRKYTIYRVCTLMRKMRASHLVLEEGAEIDPSSPEGKRIEVELSSLSKRLGTKVVYSLKKLTFVCADEITSAAKLQALPETAFLGYAIIINLQMGKYWWSYIFESIIREKGWLKSEATSQNTDAPQKWTPLENHFLHVKRPFPCCVAGRIYSLPGTFFCQQNTITHVCAHACALMMLNNCPDRSDILTSEDINRAIGTDHEHRMLKIDSAFGSNDSATHQGLDIMELEKVFRTFNYYPFRQHFDHTHRNYREFLYGFIESGYPALLTFSIPRDHDGVGFHVLSVFGHTLNSDSWFPLAFAGYVPQDEGFQNRVFLSTIDWVDDFIVHDDNFGMQLCFPAHSFRPEGKPDPGFRFKPVEAIGIFPSTHGVALLAHDAERMAWLRVKEFCMELYRNKIIPPGHVNLRYFLAHILNEQKTTAVFRTLLVQKDDYLRHLMKEDNDGKKYSNEEIQQIKALIDPFERFWLVEVTEPDLFVADKAKLIDVLIDPRVAYSDINSHKDQTSFGVIAMRFPGFLLAPNNASDGYDFVFSQSAVLGTYPMYKLDPRVTMW